MIIYYNATQQTELKSLHENHKRISKIEFDTEIKKLDFTISTQEIKFIHTQISRDGLLGALRRIKWAYNNYSQAQPDCYGCDEREISVLIFFHNFKCFIEIIKKCFPKLAQNKKNKVLFEEVTTIRNFFAHSYEKDFNDHKTFTRISPNNHTNNGLLELEIFDFDTAEKKYSLFFSFNLFSVEVVRLINDLEKHLSKYDQPPIAPREFETSAIPA